MFDNNPTLDILSSQPLADHRQGEVLVLGDAHVAPGTRRFYIESYGCQMNFSDSEIVAAVLQEAGFAPTSYMEEAELLLINTCSIREKAEDTVRKRLQMFNAFKKTNPGIMVGVLGCMAERLKSKFLDQEKIVDIVVGPDAYRDLPKLVAKADEGERGINVYLSREETYADISPVRLDSNGVSAFISIMRGCDNMCSFCVVPYTRGRERSRDLVSILAEARDLFAKGYREVTLLGQNVDSYKWSAGEGENVVNFAQLLEQVALIDPLLRVRFMTSHPKDMHDEVLFTMARYDNICKYIHLPVQSGNSRILELMNRGYTREWYMARVNRIYEIMPEVALSVDLITGFCSETEEEHQDTLSIMSFAKYSMAYMFSYSERPGTPAARKLTDDIPESVKSRRLAEIVALHRQIALDHNIADLGKTFEVLIDGDSKRSIQQFKGRNSQNKVVVFDKQEGLKPGDYVQINITEITSGTLRGVVV